MKKLFPKVFSLFLCLSLLIGSAFADWSRPNISLTIARNDSNRWVVPQSSINFSQDAVNEIISLSYDNKYVTIDHSARKTVDGKDVEAALDAQYYASTLPGAYYDTDDDDSDQNYEEAEVTILGTPQVGTAYTFTTRFVRAAGENSGIIQANTQYSFWNNIDQEYDTVPFSSDTNVWKTWSVSAAKSTPVLTANFSFESNMTEDTSAPITNYNMSLPRTILELNQLIQDQHNKYTQLMSTSPVMEFSENDQKATADITFAGPISMPDFQALMGSSNAIPLKYQAKFVDNDNAWWTIGTSELNEQELIEFATEAIEGAGKTLKSYEGITYAEVEFDKMGNAYNILYNSSAVYFVDMTKTLADITSESSVLSGIPDYSWHLENLPLK